jgi:hypothetical protein
VSVISSSDGDSCCPKAFNLCRLNSVLDNIRFVSLENSA